MLAACGSADGEAPGGEADATTSASASAVPAELATPELGDQRPIPFDPCLDIAPATYTGIGFDPATLKREDEVGDSRSSIGCVIRGPRFFLGVFAGNETYDSKLEDDRSLRHGDPARLISVNGRDAFVGITRTSRHSCTLVMSAAFGNIYVVGDFSFTGVEHKRHELDSCAEVERIVTAIEPSLPEGS
jgi:hypothetical protein